MIADSYFFAVFFSCSNSYTTTLLVTGVVKENKTNQLVSNGKIMKSIENVINEFVDENEMGDEYIFAQIENVWNKNFADIVKNNIHLIKFENGVLYMRSDSAAWKKEILLRNSEIINKFNLNFGTNVIRKLNI